MTTALPSSVLWALVGIAVAFNLVGGVFTEALPPALLAAFITLALVAFALVHGSAAYGVRGIAAFAVICLVVSNIIENIGVVTGIPFGSYRYSDNLGPKLFLVPVLIGPAYFGMAYLAWTVARVLLDTAPPRHCAQLTYALPVVASFVMTACNLSYDPLISTVRGGWVWTNGGAYFGVPIANFAGWFATSYLFFQLFALYRRRRSDLMVGAPQFRSFWLQPIVLYGSISAAVVLGALTTTTAATVTDQAGVAWRIRDVYAGCALVSTFTMGAFTVLSLVKVAARPPTGA
jgi:putative membrane protein